MNHRSLTPLRSRRRTPALLVALGVTVAASNALADYQVIAFRNTPGFTALMNENAAAQRNLAYVKSLQVEVGQR